MDQELEDRIQLAERLATIEANQKHQTEKLDLILQQTQRTNGRVTKLEEWRAVVKSNVSVIAGITSAIISAAFALILTMVKQ